MRGRGKRKTGNRSAEEETDAIPPIRVSGTGGSFGGMVPRFYFSPLLRIFQAKRSLTISVFYVIVLFSSDRIWLQSIGIEGSGICSIFLAKI